MLSVEGLDLHYGAAQALRGVSVDAKAGAVTCVLGRNGVGKTSLLRAICGQHRPSKGRILWQGEDISTLQPYERARRGIAFVPGAVVPAMPPSHAGCRFPRHPDRES